MPILTHIKPSEYHDSVTLMLVAKALVGLPGVEDAAVVMGTPANCEIVAAAGLLTPEGAAAAARRSVDCGQGGIGGGRASRASGGWRSPRPEDSPHHCRTHAAEVAGLGARCASRR